MAKILIIDDDPDIVEVTRILLEKSGHSVTAASNGMDGLATARREKPQAILLDVMMTTKSEGLETARALRKDPETARIPIVMMTGVNQEAPLRLGPDQDWLPVDAFLDKPVQAETLLSALKRILG